MSDIHLSEIFPLTFDKLNIASFRLSPTIGQEIGNRLGWHFSKQFPGVVVVWKQGFFYILTQSNIKTPPQNDWKEALAAIQLKIKDKIGDRSYFIQWVNEAIVDANIIGQLAVRILKLNCRFTPKIVFDQNKAQVKRECKFWDETFAIGHEFKPAITLDIKSSFVYRETLDIFFNHHPYRNDPEKLLIGLLVRDVETNGTGTIVELNGTIREQRNKLIEQATGATSKEKLLIAPEDQPVVSIQFSKNSRLYDYAMAALRPCLNSKNASKFEIEHGALLEHSKITYQERKELLSQYKQDAHKVLVNYGLKLEKQCLNSKQYPNLFWKPQVKLEDTLLLFGKNAMKKNATSTKSKTLKGLYEGGVYRRHQEFNNPERKIRVGVLNFSTIDDRPFAHNLQQELKKHQNNKFQLKFISENIRKTSLAQLSETEAKVKVETLIDEILQIPVDLVLIFLPESDRGQDDSDGTSIYALVSSRLLRRKIASQVIYEKTLEKQSKHVIYHVVLGIIAKLGNLPFILAEPLAIADYFVGLDIARKPKKNSKGSINACAIIRLYDCRGEFIRYQIADDSLIEGEEISKKILQNFLPINIFKDKKVLIYRDGSFRGDEIKNLIEWGQAINSQFILVECVKSQIPRLYDVSNKQLEPPTRGLALCLSSKEAILVTTKVDEKIGVPRPLRLKIKEEGTPANIRTLLDTTLKLTLLHHGSLKDPRLPIPLFGADRIAYRRLQGIYPGELEGDKQYWL